MKMDLGAFQRSVSGWVLKAFGTVSATDVTERTYRFAEEALELCQAAGMTRLDMEKMIDYVYERKAGQIPQEVAGVLTTLAALSSAFNVAMDYVAADELVRVNVKIEEIREKQKGKIRSSAVMALGPHEDRMKG
jgi:hypothetical protein